MVNIYGLKDNGVIFYIGKCINMKVRLTNHICQSALLSSETHKRIADIINNNRNLEMELIEQCEDDKGREREIYYITFHSKNGAMLTNIKFNSESNLSKLEIQVLLLLAKDMDTDSIAPILQKSPRTIETIRQHLKKKARVKTLPGLIIWGIEQKYITVNV